MADMKPGKMTDEELEAELSLCGGAYAVRRLRDHIAALEAERDAAQRQGRADYRALHDALGWAHEWHGKELPPPWRAVTALIAERDEARRKLTALAAEHRSLQAERDQLASDLRAVRTSTDGVWRWQGDGQDHPESLTCPVVMTAGTLRDILAARHAREANRAERQRALDAEAALVAVRKRADDTGRLVSEMVRASGNATDKMLAVVRYVLGVGAGERARSSEAAALAAAPADPLHLSGRCTCAGEGTCTWCNAAAKRAQAAMNAPATADAFAKVLAVLEMCRALREDEIPEGEIPAAIADLVSLERHMGAMGRAIQDAPHGETCMVGRSALVKHCTCWKRATLTDAPPGFTLEEVERAVRESGTKDEVVQRLAALRR